MFPAHLYDLCIIPTPNCTLDMASVAEVIVAFDDVLDGKDAWPSISGVFLEGGLIGAYGAFDKRVLEGQYAPKLKVQGLALNSLVVLDCDLVSIHLTRASDNSDHEKSVR